MNTAAALLALTAAAVFTVYAVLWNRSPDLDPRSGELLSSGAILAATPAVLTLGAALLGYTAATLVLGPVGLDAGYPDAATIGAAATIAAIVVGGCVVADPARRHARRAASATQTRAVSSARRR